MTVFQVLGVAFCSVQLVGHVRQLVRGRGLHHLLFASVWVTALVLLLAPSVTTWLAMQVGIGRGVDVVIYALVLLFVWAHFHQYMRYKLLQHTLTSLVRELAIRDARPPNPSS